VDGKAVEDILLGYLFGWSCHHRLQLLIFSIYFATFEGLRCQITLIIGFCRKFLRSEAYNNPDHTSF
jgi:hypothetical protein